MKFTLDQLENRLQALIEVHLLSYLPSKRKDGIIAQQLAAAMHSNLVEKDGKKFAPSVYTLVGHPESIKIWRADAQLVENFKQILDSIAGEANFGFDASPTITLASDTRLSLDEIQILASQQIETLAETQGMETNAQNDKEINNPIPHNAFLIVHGTKIFPLTESVANIGRRIENNLTIDDPRVSRDHAQLRAIKGRFVLFDLNSTGGTFVNGQRTSQSILYPGDVISLAGVSLIFGQDNPPTRKDLNKTAPLNTGSAERPTAILRTTASFKKPKDK